MTVKICADVWCDLCEQPAQATTAGFESRSAALTNARDLGWQRPRVGRKVFDVCPDCAFLEGANCKLRELAKKVGALVALLACLLSVGCTSRVLELDAKYAPLRAVQEVTDKVIPPHVVTTIGATSYVPDMKTFLADWPEGVDRDAILRHERVHTIRQGWDPLWFARYAAEPSFRWQEEQAGYREELLAFKAAGRWIDVEGYVETLSGEIYTVAGEPMVDEETARDWIHEVLSGK